MAPSKREESLENSPGRDDFASSLSQFAKEREYVCTDVITQWRALLTFSFVRTQIDWQARVNGKHIDLFKFYNLVTSRGGYDAVSAEKLEWRKVGNEFGLGATNAAAYAFALKTVYYKNLV